MNAGGFLSCARRLLRFASLGVSAASILAGVILFAAESDKPAAGFQALLKGYSDAQAAFDEAYKAAQTDEDRNKAMARMPSPASYSPRFLEYARTNAAASDAVDALAWIVTNAAESEKWGEALDLLIKNHGRSAMMGDVAQTLVYVPRPASESALRTLMTESPHREVKGRATLALASWLKQEVELVAMLKGSVLPNGFEEYLGKETVAKLRAADPAALSAESEKLFERVTTDFADLESPNGSLVAEAKSHLFEIRNLAVGKVAPEIEGEDIEGAKFKLSEYRGKVVVLDFWGDW